MYRNFNSPPIPECEEEFAYDDKEYKSESAPTPLYYSTSCPMSFWNEGKQVPEVETRPIAINADTLEQHKVQQQFSYIEQHYSPQQFYSGSPDCTAIDKIRKRRESHNAVERRRRDHINECIQRLNSLVPVSDDNGVVGDALRTNKGEILLRTVEYIQSLKSAYDQALAFILKVDPTWHPK